MNSLRESCRITGRCGALKRGAIPNYLCFFTRDRPHATFRHWERTERCRQEQRRRGTNCQAEGQESRSTAQPRFGHGQREEGRSETEEDFRTNVTPAAQSDLLGKRSSTAMTSENEQTFRRGQLEQLADDDLPLIPRGPRSMQQESALTEEPSFMSQQSLRTNAEPETLWIIINKNEYFVAAVTFRHSSFQCSTLHFSQEIEINTVLISVFSKVYALCCLLDSSFSE